MQECNGGLADLLSFSTATLSKRKGFTVAIWFLAAHYRRFWIIETKLTTINYWQPIKTSTKYIPFQYLTLGTQYPVITITHHKNWNTFWLNKQMNWQPNLNTTLFADFFIVPLPSSLQNMTVWCNHLQHLNDAWSVAWAQDTENKP